MRGVPQGSRTGSALQDDEFVFAIEGRGGARGGAAAAGGADASADAGRIYRAGKASGARQAAAGTNRNRQFELDAAVGATGVREDDAGAGDCAADAERVCVVQRGLERD